MAYTGCFPRLGPSKSLTAEHFIVYSVFQANYSEIFNKSNGLAFDYAFLEPLNKVGNALLHRRPKVRRLKHARAGLAAIEYVLIASLIVVGLVMSVWTIGQATEQTYTQVVSSLDTTLKDSPSDAVSINEDQAVIEPQLANNDRIEGLLMFSVAALTTVGVGYLWYTR